MVRFLLKHGAHIDSTDVEGNSPLHRVARDSYGLEGFRTDEQCLEVIAILIEAGTDVSIENNAGETAFEICSTEEKQYAFKAALKSLIK